MTYLADLGPPAPRVLAVTARDAYLLTLLCIGRSADQVEAGEIYEFSAAGDLLRRIPVQSISGEEVAA